MSSGPTGTTSQTTIARGREQAVSRGCTRIGLGAFVSKVRIAYIIRFLTSSFSQRRVRFDAHNRRDEYTTSKPAMSSRKLRDFDSHTPDTKTTLKTWPRIRTTTMANPRPTCSRKSRSGQPFFTDVQLDSSGLGCEFSRNDY